MGYKTYEPVCEPGNEQFHRMSNRLDKVVEQASTLHNSTASTLRRDRFAGLFGKSTSR